MPINAKEIARTAWHNLKQTNSVQAYVARFRQLLLQLPDISTVDRLHCFAMGLKPAAQQQVRLHQPATLQAAIELAERADSVAYRPGPVWRSPVPARYHGGAQPMELDA